MYVWIHDGLSIIATLVCFHASAKLYFIIITLSFTLKDKSMVPQCVYEKNVQNQFTKLAESLTTFYFSL